MKALLELVKKHKEGKSVGVYSVCCSHPLVLESAIRHAKKQNETLVIEATSNQVNQYGGYTGMTPVQYKQKVLELADQLAFAHDRIILGGDHLGPNCWQDLPAEEAMLKSEVLIKDYVQAGFRKIHLDCSMSCKGDPVPLSDEIVAERASRLCKIAEAAYQEAGGEAPVYIIGTEVPVPGGAQEELDHVVPTDVKAASKTIDVHKAAFANAGLTYVWNRVVALVVQPGVEFDHHNIIHFAPESARELSQYINNQSHMLYEAHSTDYQSAHNLASLVKGHFAILKVGPWLTFALREACWALDAIESEWIEADKRANLKSTILSAMQSDPQYWSKYYSHDTHLQKIDCQFSLSDRIRYYWPKPEVDEALNKLIVNLSKTLPPLTLISQHLPVQYKAIMAGELEFDIKHIVFHKIEEVLNQYSNACNQRLSA